MLTLWLTYSLLCLSAFAAGVVNAIAGGGTLLTFPMLLSAGMSSKAANETSTVALVPGSLAGAWGFRRDLAGARAWLVLLIAPSVLGGLTGSLLLTELQDKVFELVVPWLLLLAATLFAVQPYVNRFIHPTVAERSVPWWLRGLLVVFQFFVGVYGGYFGAGIGILMLASLGLMGVGDLNRMNAIKTILASCINGVSVLVFVARPLVQAVFNREGGGGGRGLSLAVFTAHMEIDYSYAIPMALAAIAGGYCGASLGRLLPRVLVRSFVICVGLALAAYYFAKQAGLFETAGTS